jgi:hypothetical protein
MQSVPLARNAGQAVFWQVALPGNVPLAGITWQHVSRQVGPGGRPTAPGSGPGKWERCFRTTIIGKWESVIRIFWGTLVGGGQGPETNQVT